jgi:carbon storage regulator
MLVLSRKQGERIRIGNDIVITITKVGRRRAWVGIDAPQTVAVQREEVTAKSACQVRHERRRLGRRVLLNSPR